MILLKQLLTELFGKTFTAVGQTDVGRKEFVFGVTKNTREDELPYRITVYSDGEAIQPHYSMTQEELDVLNLTVGDRSFIDVHNSEQARIPDRIRSKMLNNLGVSAIEIKP